GDPHAQGHHVPGLAGSPAHRPAQGLGRRHGPLSRSAGTLDGATENAATAPAVRPPALELDGVSARLGGRTVWNDLSVVVRRGEFVAVLGPNGAGKSTLLRLLLGLLPRAEGDVKVLGTSPVQARRRVSYLPQRHGF